MEGLYDKKPPGRPRKFGEEIRTKIEELVRTPPRNLGLPFTNWTARALAQYLIREGIVEYIGEQTIRDILKERGITIQRRKKWIDSPD